MNQPNEEPISQRREPLPMRERAERLVREHHGTALANGKSAEEILEELQVHQVELEIQNEELRDTQERLSVSLERYNDLFDHAPVGYVETDREGRILEANRTLARWLGCGTTDLVGSLMTDWVAGKAEDQDAWFLHWRKLSATVEPQTSELRLRQTEGTLVPILLESNAITSGGDFIGARCSMIDISKRRRTELRLEWKKELLQGIFDHAPVLFTLWDAQLQRFTLNRHAEEVLGWTSEDANEGDFMAKVYPDPDYRARVAGYMNSLESGWREFECTAKDGRTIPTEWANVALTDETKLGIGIDLRERKRSEAQLVELNARLEQRVQERTVELRRLASELSVSEQVERQRIAGDIHDGLTQLLSSANIWLGVAMDGEPNESTLSPLKKARGIIGQALDSTRALTFELSCPALEELGLSAALDELCRTMSNEYAVRFGFECDGDDVPMAADQQMILYRGVRELMINVLKHSGAAAAKVHFERWDGHVRIQVSDDGTGFEATTAGRGFSPSGGYGLFNLREYLQHLGGNLEILSVPGGGTQVEIILPLGEA